jgi:hypothetical protein
MRKSFLFGLSAAVLTLAIQSVSLPASAQGIVPHSTTTAPKGTAQQRGASPSGNRGDIGATAKGIKDKGVSGCGNCGLTGRMKNGGGPGGGPHVNPKAKARTER